jgi:hypothetical protein
MYLTLEWQKPWRGAKTNEHLSSDGGQSNLCGHGQQGSGSKAWKLNNTPAGQKRCQECIDICTRMILAVDKRREENRIERMRDD